MLATVAFGGVIVVFLGLALIPYASYVFDGRGRGLGSAWQEATYFWTFGAAGVN